MDDYLILDGYNVINSWPKLQSLMEESLDTARNKLINKMTEYGAFMGIKVIIVFDAHQVKGTTLNKEKRQGVEIVFTREHETADCYIEKLIGDLSKNNNVAVVTNDRIEQYMILGSGATRIPVRELIDSLGKIKTEINRKLEAEKSKKNTLSDFMDPSMLEVFEKFRRGL